ncbi:MAG: Tab2/Atab2 family RNA-binding protein [Aphanothece sp. CMT-3BRIN-NPC111]|jgi:hypothetical protein|nr:Tab2/Atab2 family RNA-binding protein [Aphanothece sp. CMT-3BRIN-NPC111]
MSTIWELDFYSRPILDEKQKKLWEVLVCESPLDTRHPPESLFRYAQYCPSTQVNSVWLRNALEEAMAKSQATPKKIRFFRRQMNNMITKACKELGIDAQPSRRTFALHSWLQERMQEVYPTHPNYQPSNTPSVQFETQPPQPLPDALIGQQWAFVTLEASAFEEMHEWEIGFGEAFPLGMLKLTPKTRISGIVLYSPRAVPMAGWMSGIEPAFIKFYAAPQARLLLESGGTDSWILVKRLDVAGQTEAASFEEAKQKAKGVHFLAIQSSPEAEDFAGFWLLQELQMA